MRNPLSTFSWFMDLKKGIPLTQIMKPNPKGIKIVESVTFTISGISHLAKGQVS